VNAYGIRSGNFWSLSTLNTKTDVGEKKIKSLREIGCGCGDGRIDIIGSGL
jgi:hypothetical protein